ncbi:MAG: hypothetical protein EP347_10100 [Alphaproteobacteria bacterium]|nr:MAG: hypothetical protein EP347_10100 [Alphaproteobacteria bacterium]
MSDHRRHWHKYKHHHPIIAALILMAIGFYVGRYNADVTSQDVVETIGKTLEATGEILIDAGDSLKQPGPSGDPAEPTAETAAAPPPEEAAETTDGVEPADPAPTLSVPERETDADSGSHSEIASTGTFYQTNEACIDIIKASQELRLEAYETRAGDVLIGYGHTRTATKGMTITADEADMLLRRDLRAIEQEVADQLTLSVNENEFSAMVCLAHNIGKSAFANSAVLKETNADNRRAAADAFLVWNKIQINGDVVELEELNQRRQAERALYLD